MQDVYWIDENNTISKLENAGEKHFLEKVNSH